MVWRNVEYNGNSGTESVDRLKLETGDFQHNNGFRRCPLDQRNRRGADVASDQGGISARRDNLARQGRGGRLPVRTGDGDDASRQELSRQFSFTYYGLAQRACLHQRRRIYGNTGTDHDQILPAERALAVPSGFHCYAVIQQDRNLFPKLIFRLGVRHSDARAPCFQKQSRSHARFTEANHEHAFVVDLHRTSFNFQLAVADFVLCRQLQLALGNLKLEIYLSFSVVSANNANTSEAIQKRTMIFDSDQPSNSK